MVTFLLSLCALDAAAVDPASPTTSIPQVASTATAAVLARSRVVVLARAVMIETFPLLS